MTTRLLSSIRILIIPLLFAALEAANAQSLSKLLPAPVPYCGNLQDYFLGSGVSGAAGDVTGVWDFLIGPDYTSPCFIRREALSVIIDGQPQSLCLQMYRGRKTGLFYGTQTIGDLKVTVADITNDKSAWVARLVMVDNISASRSHRLQVKAVILPNGGQSRVGYRDAVCITMNSNQWCFGNKETRNWATRESLIRFSSPCMATRTTSAFELVTTPHIIKPGTTYTTGLYHYQFYKSKISGPDVIRQIKARKPLQDLQTCRRQWDTWIDSGRMYDSKINDPRARDVIEGSLIACKMQQNRTGGFIAGVGVYANAYVRDMHGAVKLLLLTGHDAEVRKAIEAVDQKWQVSGFIPNYWSMGSDSFIGHSQNDDAETPGYYVLIIRDYYRATHDLEFVQRVYPSMKYAIDAQLNFMARHDWNMTFNGDETERYCVKRDGQTYGGSPAIKEWIGIWNGSWSFSSAAIAVASTQFFIDYLNMMGKHGMAGVYSDKLDKARDAIDRTFWRTDLSPPIHDWERGRNGSWPATRLPNYDLLPLWIGARLNEDRENSDASAMTAYINPDTGFLPTSPGDVEGMCGDNLGYLLYDLKKLGNPKARSVYQTIMHSSLLSCWGTVSEYYGPGGASNGHNYRPFESGIISDAIIRYFIGFE